jgi:hypothetical protein
VSELDRILGAIKSIHAAGLDASAWPSALELMTSAVGGVGAAFEVHDKRKSALTTFHSFGLNPGIQGEYADHYAAISPRVQAALHWRTGRVVWDYDILDEAAMRRDPFYAEFLPRFGLRYFAAGIVANNADEFVGLGVQRSARQGHPSRREVGRLRHLLPHVQQAYDVSRRLKGALGICRGRCAGRLCPHPRAQPQHGLHPSAALARKDRLEPPARADSQAQRIAAAVAGGVMRLMPTAS